MIGTSLGPYRIDAALGSGGMGTVWRATGPSGVVALKLVHPHLLSEPEFLTRFLREADLGGRVVHPNVVRTFGVEVFHRDGRPVHALVMEPVEGQTLRALLADLDRVPEELCRHIGREVARGLAAIHAAGIVHRDLKPENVLVTKEHLVKVMDLGVARLVDEALRLSQTGMFVGSVAYAAPEQFADAARGADARGDLHGLGLVLYELACGQHPYAADRVLAVIHRLVHERPRRLGEANPQLSPFFEEVVHTLLAKRPEARFASAAELARVLEEGEEGAWWKHRAQALRAETRRPLRRIRIPRETAVYGREAEIERLGALYDRAKAGRGQVVLIQGEAGIGKSRLVDELISRLQAKGEDLNFLHGSFPPGGAATATSAFSAAYREQLGGESLEESLRACLERTPVLVPAFAAFLRGEPTPTGVEPLTKDSLQTCFVHATHALAGDRTTVVLIDDLHFAPDEGLALFSSLALAVPGHRVLLVGAMRPGVSDAWVAGVTRLDHTTAVLLPRLGPKDLVRLLEDAFHSQTLASSLGAQVALKSDGNPFFVFEIVRGLREGQFITRRDDGTWVTSRTIGDIQIPSSVQDLVNARVSALSEEERNLLDVAACLGFEFDPLLVGDVLGIAQIPLVRSLAQIEKRHRLVRSAGRHFVFDHHQVQEALYGAMPELLREPYHAALAGALEARSRAAERDPAALDGALGVELCEHFLQGAQGERALRYLARAQAHLHGCHLNAKAAALAERALAVPGLLEGPERAEVLLRLCGALDPMGCLAREEEAAREAGRLAEAARDDGLRTRAELRLGGILRRMGRNTEAEATLRGARETARSCGDRRAEATADVGLGLVLHALGRLPHAREHLESGLARRRELADAEGEASALVALGNLCRGERRLGDAQGPYERALAIYRRLGVRRGEAAATGGLGHVFLSEGRLAEARECHERALATYRELGDRQGEASATSAVASICLKQGLPAEAREHRERSLAIYTEIGHRSSVAVLAVNLGIDVLFQGRYGEARGLFERAVAACREVGNRKAEAGAHAGLGDVFLALGRLREARERHEVRLAICREVGHRGGESFALHSLGDVLAEEGDLAAAKEHYLAARALGATIGDRFVVALTDAALGSVEAESGDAALAQASLTRARGEASAIGEARVETLASCRLAALTGANVEDAVTAFAASQERLAPGERREMRWLLWKATRDPVHLAEAKRMLEEVLSENPEDRTSIRENLRVSRAILAAVEPAEA